MTCSVEVNDLLSRPGQMSAPDRLLLTYRHPLTRPTTIRRVQCLLTNSPSAGNAVAGRSRRATTSTAVATTVPEAKPRNLPEFMISFSPAYPRLSPIPNNNTGNDDNPDPNNAKLGKSTVPFPYHYQTQTDMSSSPQSPPSPPTNPPPLPITTGDPLTQYKPAPLPVNSPPPPRRARPRRISSRPLDLTYSLEPLPGAR